MSSLQKSLPGETARRWLSRAFSPRTMESVFDPFLADLQADWTRTKCTRSARYARWSLFLAYVSLVVQVAACALGSLFGPSYELAPAANFGAAHADGGMATARRCRYAAPLVIAALITFGLFVVMSALIAGQPDTTTDPPSIPVSLLRVPHVPEPIVKAEPEFPELPEPIAQPVVDGILNDQPTAKSPTLPDGPAEGWFKSISDGYADPNIDMPGSDKSEMPIVRVAPAYPRRALDRGIEGWVEVEFTVTEVGGVSDPKVLSAHPSSIFDRAALRAIERWKYEPKIVDGQPVSRPGVRTRLRFELTGDGSGSD